MLMRNVESSMTMAAFEELAWQSSCCTNIPANVSSQLVTIRMQRCKEVLNDRSRLRRKLSDRLGEISFEQLDGRRMIMKMLPQRGGLWLVSILSYQSKLGLSPITTAR